MTDEPEALNFRKTTYGLPRSKAKANAACHERLKIAFFFCLEAPSFTPDPGSAVPG